MANACYSPNGWYVAIIHLSQYNEEIFKHNDNIIKNYSSTRKRNRLVIMMSLKSDMGWKRYGMECEGKRHDGMRWDGMERVGM